MFPEIRPLPVDSPTHVQSRERIQELTCPTAGNFTGPLLFRPQDAPLYENGWKGVVITAIAALVLVAAYRVVCIRENRRRDKMGIAEGHDNAFEDDLTDMKVREILLKALPSSLI